VAFYVPLGPRGMLFRAGTFVIGIWGGLVYRMAYRRRTIMVSNSGPYVARNHGAGSHDALGLVSPIPVTLVQAALLGESEPAAALL
jgi:hypothetical protein